MGGPIAQVFRVVDGGREAPARTGRRSSSLLLATGARAPRSLRQRGGAAKGRRRRDCGRPRLPFAADREALRALRRRVTAIERAQLANVVLELPADPAPVCGD